VIFYKLVVQFRLASFKNLKVNKRGMALIFAIFVLLILGILSYVFYGISFEKRFSTNVEARKIQARYLALAASEKAVLMLKKRYTEGKFKWRYPDQGDCPLPSSYFHKKTEAGEYKIVSIGPFYCKKGIHTIGPFNGISETINGVKIGKYDILLITTEGIAGSKVKVRLKTIVKLLRKEVVY